MSVPTPPRARPRRAHWQALLEAWRRSGLSQAAFCRRRGVPPGTLAFWKHTLAREARPFGVRARPARPARPTFVPVQVATPPRPAAALAGPVPTASGAIEIILAGGLRVRVRGQVDVPWLGQVIRTLAMRGC